MRARSRRGGRCRLSQLLRPRGGHPADLVLLARGRQAVRFRGVRCRRPARHPENAADADARHQAGGNRGAAGGLEARHRGLRGSRGDDRRLARAVLGPRSSAAGRRRLGGAAAGARRARPADGRLSAAIQPVVRSPPDRDRHVSALAHRHRRSQTARRRRRGGCIRLGTGSR